MSALPNSHLYGTEMVRSSAKFFDTYLGELDLKEAFNQADQQTQECPTLGSENAYYGREILAGTHYNVNIRVNEFGEKYLSIRENLNTVHSEDFRQPGIEELMFASLRLPGEPANRDLAVVIFRDVNNQKAAGETINTSARDSEAISFYAMVVEFKSGGNIVKTKIIDSEEGQRKHDLHVLDRENLIEWLKEPIPQDGRTIESSPNYGGRLLMGATFGNEFTFVNRVAKNMLKGEPLSSSPKFWNVLKS